MAVDKNKIIAEATKLVQKGAIDKAIQTYQRILQEDAKDVRILLKVGELFQKKGDDKSAADAFKRVAETYAEQGFFLKSVAVYKQIVKLDPDDVRVNERLAGLYQQLGLMSDAMSQLQLMAATYEKQADAARLTDVLKRMVELDPDNIASSIKLGELYMRAGQGAGALEHLKRAAEYLKKHSRAEEYLKVAERIASLQPNDVGLSRELAHIHLAKGDTKRALAKLQLCFKADPKDVDTLTLLAQAFRDLGQVSKTLSVYKELARVHEESGRRQEARSTWRRVQELAPDDPEAREALGGSATATPMPGAHRAVAPAAPAPRPAAPAPGPPPAARAAPPPGPPPGVRAPAAAAAAPASSPATAGGDGASKLLTETDVYVKYGLHDKALDHLRKILSAEPDNPDALEKSREIQLAAGRAAEAADAGARAVKAFVARGLNDRGREALARLRQIAPSHPQLGALAAAVGSTEEIALEPGDMEEVALLQPKVPAAPPPDEDALALAAARADGDELVEEDAAELVGGGPELGDALAAAAAARSAESEDDVVEEEPEAPPRPPVPPARPAAQPARVAARPAAAPPAPAARAPAAGPAARISPLAAVKPPPAAAASASPAPAPAEEAELDLSDELEEADFFVQQGLFDDAREALGSLLAFYPGHSQVLSRIAELDRRAAPGAARQASAGAAPFAPPGGDESFDIARELAEEIGSTGGAAAADEDFQYSVEDVFSQFKKGVEQTVKPEDSATHYDLGIAYREMGLLDDAVHEFETALQGNDRKKEVDCLSMVGLCRMAQGDAAAAVEAFRRALGSAHLTRDAAKAVLYELAAAYEAAAEPEHALHCYHKVKAADPAFRDAVARIAALGGGPGRPPPPDPARNGASGRAVRAPAAPPPPPGPRPGAKKNIGYL
ncbi:MAG TPA: tetratricopeptide repeat protein [Anaeromyxobacteraceae bacterium]|nr:tetratricopeptide repeat protein [Anaeromyxobacteraceae bacterium]